uniref:PCNA-interacting partner n=1 Tax=Sphaeramia orbicularis TaxID=375764 RepID=A0A673BP00_9TELE
MEVSGDHLKLMVKTFRRECHRIIQSERTTIHGADGMLMVLQLAMAQVNKQQGGEFKVALSDVLMAWKQLLLDKLHLPPPNFACLENYDLILEAYESFLKRSNTVDLVDIFSMYKQLRVDSDPEELVSSVQLFQFLSGRTEASELQESTVPSTPSSKSRSCSSQVKMAVRRVFFSYLSLLVNSKNDMALTLTLDVPTRTLGRQAFTDIKHAAQNNNTSLFLAVTSFVRAIQLGGKGYAPTQSDPLRKHIKGLSDFVQFLDNLEEILGEISDPSVCGVRLVATIRAALVKGRSNGDAVYTAAEETAQELKERICQLHQIQKQTANGSMIGISPARPKAYAVNHATAYGGRDTVKVLMALLDEEALTPPCRNKADLLSEDQPVLSGAEGTCLLTLFRLVRERVIRSQFACTYKDEDELPLNRVLDFPSTTKPSLKSPNKEQSRVQQGATLGPGSGNAQNRDAGPSSRKEPGIKTQNKANKRKQVESDQYGGSENEPPQKKQPTSVSVKMPAKNVSKASNKKKLITGQAKLTSFFRV